MSVGAFKRVLALTASTVLVAALAACGASGPVKVSASSIVPLDTLQDWVTYGDYFVEMTVVSEERLRSSPEGWCTR